MSNYDGASKALDDLRGLIIRDDSGLAPLDITMLGRVEAWLESTEMSLRHEQSKVVDLEGRVGRYEAKIAQWMPIVATSQESSELPEGWTWRESWKFSAEGPDGVVCEPDMNHPWCSDAPRSVMQVVGRRSCSRAAGIYANQVAKPLAERAYVRDTREGEWPDEYGHIHCWDGVVWVARQFRSGVALPGHLWLPAPPPPGGVMSSWIGRQVIIFGWGEEHEGELMSIDYVAPVLGIDKDSHGGYMALIRYEDGQFGTFSLSPECASMRAAGTPPPPTDD